MKSLFLKKVFLYSVLCTLFSVITGCTMLTEGVKGFAGISTKILEDKRADAISMTFERGYDDCYREVQLLLSDIAAYIYARDDAKKLIAIYLSNEDTTPVGIFFVSLDF